MQTFFPSKLLCLPLACLFLAGPAHAHRTWLLPSATQLEGKEPWVTLDAAVSENLFDFDTNAIKLDGVKVIGPDGAAVNIENPFQGRLRGSFDIKLSKPGTYRVNLVQESVMVNYKLNGEAKRWRGAAQDMARDIPANAQEVRSTSTYNRLETFVSAGKPNQAALVVVGKGLELQPLGHPNEMAVGEKAGFRLLLNGKPLTEHALSIVPGGVRYRGVLQEIHAVTDAKGEFTVAWPQAGMYWVHASYPARNAMAASNPATATPGQPAAAPAQRYGYSGTFEILPQ